MARIKVVIMRLAGTARGIRLLRQNADLDRGRRRPQKGGYLFGEIARRQFADKAVAGAHPRPRRATGAEGSDESSSTSHGHEKVSGLAKSIRGRHCTGPAQ